MIPSAQTTIGHLIRLPLRLIPPNSIFTVRSGLNRGLKWRVGSSIHSCWLGIYEKGTQAQIAALVRPDMTAWDIGANAGFFTLALSRLCREVVAFEPFAENVCNLLLHQRINGTQNITVVQTALSDSDGLTGFVDTGTNSTGRIGARGVYQMPAMTIDGAIAAGLPSPDFVKMDIEGAGGMAIRGATDLIAQGKTIWVISLHSAEEREACMAALAGYSSVTLKDADIIAIP